MIANQDEHDKNCRQAIEAIRLCTNVMGFDEKSSEAEREFLKLCEEIGSLAKWRLR